MKLTLLEVWMKDHASTSAASRALGTSHQRLSRILKETTAKWYVLDAPDGMELLRVMHKNKGA